MKAVKTTRFHSWRATIPPGACVLKGISSELEAASGRFFRFKGKTNCGARQMWITSVVDSKGFEVDGIKLSLEDSNRIESRFVVIDLIGRQTIERLMGSCRVIPVSKVVDAELDLIEAIGQDDGPKPKLEGSKAPFNLAIEAWLANLALDKIDV